MNHILLQVPSKRRLVDWFSRTFFVLGLMAMFTCRTHADSVTFGGSFLSYQGDFSFDLIPDAQGYTDGFVKRTFDTYFGPMTLSFGGGVSRAGPQFGASTYFPAMNSGLINSVQLQPTDTSTRLDDGEGWAYSVGTTTTLVLGMQSVNLQFTSTQAFGSWAVNLNTDTYDNNQLQGTPIYNNPPSPVQAPSPVPEEISEWLVLVPIAVCFFVSWRRRAKASVRTA